jgi:putative membrane protein
MRRHLINALAAMPAALTALPALAQTPGERPDYWGHGWGWGWGHMLFGSLMMILFWGGLVLLIVLAVRWLGGGPTRETPAASENKALEVLKERFARGEIDKEEFEARRRTLSD